MRKPACLMIAAALLVLLGEAQPAAAELILDGTFSTLTNQAGATSPYTYGQ